MCGFEGTCLQLHNRTIGRTGCGSVWLERLVWDQEVAGSNPVTPILINMREWLSGGVSPCQGEGRGFESRLALLLLPRNVDFVSISGLLCV